MIAPRERPEPTSALRSQQGHHGGSENPPAVLDPRRSRSRSSSPARSVNSAKRCRPVPSSGRDKERTFRRGPRCSVSWCWAHCGVRGRNREESCAMWGGEWRPDSRSGDGYPAVRPLPRVTLRIVDCGVDPQVDAAANPGRSQRTRDAVRRGARDAPTWRAYRGRRVRMPRAPSSTRARSVSMGK